MPLLAHERSGRAVAARHRPCRHRHADGGRAQCSWSGRSPTGATLGREAFLERVWAWKAESGGAIVAQLKRLGASCDWSRERFTLDEGLSHAVAKVFVQLYRERLIYKDKRLVNWDPKFQTAISDLEVVQVEMQGLVQMVARGRRAARRSGARQGSRQEPERPSLLLRLSRRRRRRRRDRRASSPSPRPGPRRCSATPRSPSIRTTSASSIWSARKVRLPLVGRLIRDHRRRIFRSRKGHGRGQDHAGARLQRFRGRQAPRGRRRAADQCPRRAKRACRSRAISTSSRGWRAITITRD